MKKYYALPNLTKIIKKLKKKNKKIVLANGCFDLIHVGHIRYLKEAKDLGDILVVALNNDSSVRSLKGPGRPLMPELDRAELIGSFSCVDYVTIFSEKDVNHVVKALQPDFHAKGSDYTVDSVPEKETVKRHGGKTAITGGPKIRSTSEIIDSISRMFQKKLNK